MSVDLIWRTLNQLPSEVQLAQIGAVIQRTGDDEMRHADKPDTGNA